MAGKTRVMRILDATSVEYVKQYKTEDGQLFEDKAKAIAHASAIALQKKLDEFLKNYHFSVSGETPAPLSDAMLAALSDIGNAASVVQAFHTNQTNQKKVNPS